ncbi:PEP-CTERM sorting domain-containing protein [Phycisphaera mikurensis]|uniref:Ice-binding protein C-terminal domain-containing protein n=1 Tax=Phycisphaera mikurensis (strain NBRC 102666 / KCTC 22515 / FYK2301M01) TaxID=1142394 RepID=I0IBY3_PHYMF|nr:PEP-CTERM sorting domain-containing protein [Phycisphaera mikurensis]MBB6442005.1 hypothetical protein [Phycisphaera mikurensis]BAM02771.1 hypothetical protein PSMK_06120 [Phycisphaera mikurensis NBRC 102666]
MSTTPSCRLPRVAAAAIAAAGVASSASAASFNDTFDSAGDIASNYTGFELTSSETAAGVDSNTYSSGSSFALDPVDGQVDFTVTIPSGFNLNILQRSVDAANLYDINQGMSLTMNASGLDPTFFDAIRNPATFGTSGGTLNADITVSVQNIDFGQYRLGVQVGGVDLPGGGQQNYAGSPDGVNFTLNIDNDSYSVLADGAELIADTAHGIVFSSLEGVTPTVGAQNVFAGGGNTSLSINSFAGTGVAVPEPATATLAAAGLGLLTLRRRGR